jgi:hypothetical protein
MPLHRGFPTTPTDRTICALSLAPSRAPPGARARARRREATQPAPRVDPPGASVQRDMPARVRPDARVRVQGDCRRERAPRCGARQRRRHKALERESPQGAQPTGIPAGVEGTYILARNGCSRCVEHPKARNGRSRATRKAAAASGACRNKESVQPLSTLSDTADLLVDSERARPSRPSPDPASTAGTRRAAASS